MNMCNNPVLLKSLSSSVYKNTKKYPSVNANFGSLLVPCGGCLGCRIDKLTLWSARCNYEMCKGHNAFVTFTYDDYHLPYNDGSLYPTLCQDDLNHYIDNIRHKIRALPFLPKGNRKDFAYFACGEYGDKFKRPHYHVLFFGLDFKEFERFFHSSWKGGMIKSLPVLTGGIRYVVDYMTKSINGSLAEEMFDNRGLERPFKSVSRGLGSELFFDHRDEIRKNHILKLGSRVIPVPSYYQNLYCNFDDAYCISKTHFNYENYLKIKRDSERYGFKDVDSYLKYSRKANELSLVSKFRNKNIPVNNIYENMDKSFDTVLPEIALN